LAESGKRDLLSIGVVLILVVVSILLYQPLQIVKDWTLVIPLIIALSGGWLAVLAGMRASSPQKYERDAFSTLSMGLLLVAIGGAWFIYGYGFGWLYSLIVILIAFAVLAVAAALKHK
jgi:peptidoglycan/LPS O-acetylase OafA/YrhL